MKTPGSEYVISIYAILLLKIPLLTCYGQAEKFNGAITDKPASRWEEAMVTGNGNMGAMMYGEPDNETMVINHCELFLPLGTKEFVKDMSGAMPEIKRAALEAGKDGPALAHQMMREKAQQKISWSDPFHPAFTFHIDTKQPSGNIQNYQLSEEFTTGELVASWDNEDGHWERKMFISRPDDVVVMKISGPKGKVNADFSMKMDHELIDVTMSVANGEIISHVTYVNGKGGYDNVARIIPGGGEILNNGKTITVNGADKVTILIRVDTWRAPLPVSQSEAWSFSPRHPDFINGYSKNKVKVIQDHLNRLSKDYDQLFATHAKVHRELFSRVRLNLEGGQVSRQVSSQSMLEEAAATGTMPQALAQKLYDACRYLIICSTGKNPANLQGIWTGTWKPDWSGDYTLDSNIQLGIQSLMSANMPELMEGYFQIIASWLNDFRLNARKLYGCRGIVSNPKASNTALYLHWGNWPGEQAIGTMGWLLHFFYDYYQFTGDEEFLRERVVPLLKESVLFYEDLLRDTEGRDSKYTFFISYSPEQDHRLYANSTFDIAVAKSVLTYLIKSCKTLNIEKENISKWEKMLGKMPGYLVNEKGELQEWAYPGTEENYNQRHHSHLLPLYQFCEFDRERDPELWNAAAKAFEAKERGFLLNEKDPDSNHITHGLMNQAQCAARLGRADVVYEVLSRLVTRQYVFPSFMISYWPGNNGYGFDPVGTIPDVVNNSLAFCWEGKLDLLPALPVSWKVGSIQNILLRDQIQVKKLAWDMNLGKIELSLKSDRSQEVLLKLPGHIKVKSIQFEERNLISQGKSHNKNRWRLNLQEGQIAHIDIKFE